MSLKIGLCLLILEQIEVLFCRVVEHFKVDPKLFVDILQKSEIQLGKVSQWRVMPEMLIEFL